MTADAETGPESSRRSGAGAASFTGLGSALRRLRIHRGLKQYEMASAAGITKAMLSAYETGKRRPSLKTLSQLLEALGADLGNLHQAMLAESYGDTLLAARQSQRRARSEYDPARTTVRSTGSGYPLASEVAEPADVYRVLGVDHHLPAAEERALSEMLRGFHNLLRYLHHHRVGSTPGPRRE